MRADSAGRVRRALAGERDGCVSCGQVRAEHTTGDDHVFRPIVVTRAYVLDDIHIRKGGGRDVVAYAAVFKTPAEIVDSDGHYNERNDPGAFNRSVAERRDHIFSVYNHARSLDGTPSDMWSVPLGKPLEITPDTYGLLTVTRYDPGEANDRILEAIKSGALRGMSYTGVFVKSTPELKGPFARYGPGDDGRLPLVTRQEIALIEYGPTPIPAFDTAEVVGVRAREAVTLLRSRAGAPLHHTDIVTDGKYDPDAEQDKMSFPTSWDHMTSMYALADNNAGDGNGSGYLRAHGALPHHHVDGNGTPGAASLSACRDALDAVDHVSGHTPEGKAKAKAHLQAHLEDAGAMVKVLPTGSSGRSPGEPAERAGDGSADGGPASVTSQAHDDFTGTHGHDHDAHGGPDVNSDGVHGHDHAHAGDHDHNHAHSPGTSGRAQTPGSPDDNDGDEASSETDAPDGTKPPGGPRPKVHAAFTGHHIHAHDAHDGPDANNDGVHSHEHAHHGDSAHHHAHTTNGMAARTTGDDDTRNRVDNTTWDAQRAWTAGAASNSPAEFYRGICAGRRQGDPKLQSSWALPHHYTPGDSPNAAGVRNALARLSSTQGLINASAAKAHLEAHLRAIGDGKDGNNGKSSSGRQPAVTGAPRHAGPDTGQPAGDSGPPQHPATTTTTRSTPMELMTIDQRVARLGEVQHRLREIDSENMGAELPPDTRTEWTALQEELIVHQRSIADAKKRAEYLHSIDPGEVGETVDNTVTGYGNTYAVPEGFTGNRNSQYGPRDGRSTTFFNPVADRQVWDVAGIRNKAHNIDEIPVLMREHAMRAIEMVRFAGPKSREDAQVTVADLLDRVDDENGKLARRILVTGSPTYDRAFGKMLAAQSINALNTEESRALQLGVDSAGGYAVPFQLDPTVILASNGAINPLRQISRVEQITGKEWDGVTSAGVTVTRVAEGTEAGTGDPLLTQPNVRTTRVQGFVPFNIELDVSWGALRSQMTNLLMDAKDVEEATSFVTGNGTAPNAAGVVNTLAGQAALQTPAPTVIINTASTATLAIGDLYALENNMAPRFRQQSSYLASKTTFNRFRQLFQALASAAFDSWVRPSAGTPATFNGYPAYEQSAMAATITSGSNVLLQGDFSQFLIVDRIGMGIELIPHLFGATNRYPVGQRGILAIWFNNSKILVPNAFRLLQTL